MTMIERQKVVAIVDDDPRVLESLEELIESAGYLPRTFPSGAALLASDYSQIDCLISDIGLPGVDGFALFDAVKCSQPDLPVFLITGRHEIADQYRTATRDIAGFFRKPFDAGMLLSEIGRVLIKNSKEGEDAD